MKVLYVSRRFYPDVIGGGQISALHIAKAAQAQGVEVHVLTWTEGIEEHQDIDGVHIHRVPIKRLKLLPRLSNMDYMYWRMSKDTIAEVQRLKPDAIHLLNFESIPLTAIRLQRKFNTPLFATVNGPLFGCFTQEAIDYRGNTCTNCRVLKRFRCSTNKWGLKGILYYIYSLWYMNLLRQSYKRINKFLMVSSKLKPLLTTMGVKPHQLATVHNPITPLKIVPPAPDNKKKIILYAGRIGWTKGIWRVIDAMQHIEDAEFHIIGRGDDLALHKERARQKGVNNKVKFFDYVPNDELAKHYRSADVVVLPCTIYESLSRMLLEACTYGIPIVASNIAGNIDIVEEGKNGYLLKTRDVHELVDRIQKAFTLKRARTEGPRIIRERFTPEVIGKQLVKQYRSP